MNRDDPPTTITGLLTGEDPKPFKPRFVRALLRCALLAAPMLTLILTNENIREADSELA